MKWFTIILPLLFIGCTSAIIHDNQSYDKMQQVSSSVNCWGYCIIPSSDGQTCIAYSTNISKQCERYFNNAK